MLVQKQQRTRVATPHKAQRPTPRKSLKTRVSTRRSSTTRTTQFSASSSGSDDEDVFVGNSNSRSPSPQPRSLSRTIHRNRIAPFATQAHGKSGKTTQPPSNHYLVVGLGNPGDSYKATRHNIGKDYVVRLTKLLGAPLDNKDPAGAYTAPVKMAQIPQEALESIVLTNGLPKPKKQKDNNNNNKNNSNNQPSDTTTTVVKDGQQPTITTTTIKVNTTLEGADGTVIQPSPSPQQQSTKNNKPPAFVPFEQIPEEITITFAHTDGYMNLSGGPINQLLQYLRIPQQNLIILHDDLDVKPGQIKLKNSGSSGGQRGIQNTLDILGHNSPFIRVRLGIGRPINGMAVNDFVLTKFTPTEREHLKFIDKYLLTTITQLAVYGYERATNHLANIYKDYQLIVNPPPPKPIQKKPAPATTPEENNNTPPRPKIDIFSMKFM